METTNLSSERSCLTETYDRENSDPTLAVLDRRTAGCVDVAVNNGVEDIKIDKHDLMHANTATSSIPMPLGNRNPPRDLDLSSTTIAKTHHKILPERQGSQSSMKECTADADEERDTFSPVNNACDYSSEFHHHHHHDHHKNNNDNGINVAIQEKDHLTSICNGDKDVKDKVLYNPRDLTLPLSSTTLNSVEFAEIVASSSSGSGSGVTNGEIDNKISEKKKIKSTSTKEEKQRQNEEIVIMETSSVSSETGSWESVFPHRSVTVTNTNNSAEVKDCCHSFLENERRNCDENVKLNPSLQYSKNSDKKINSNQSSSSSSSNEPAMSCTVGSSTACFIDASTLRDDSEMNEFQYQQLLPPQLPETGCFGPKPTTTTTTTVLAPSTTTTSTASCTTMELSTSSPVEKSSENSPEDFLKSDSTNSSSSWGKKMNLDKLEKFYRSFEMCKMKSTEDDEYTQRNQMKKEYDSSETSSCSSDSPSKVNLLDNITKTNGTTRRDVTVGAASTTNEENNLSDEEKLWKRENSKKSTKIIKDQFNKESPSDCLINTSFGSSNDDSSGSAINETNNQSVESQLNDEKTIVRKEKERKQGNLVFQNNIQQFSGHLISPKIPMPDANGGFSVEPITNIIEYSTSPAPSLAWSDLETVAKNVNYDSSSNFGDTSDYGETSSNYNHSRLQSDTDAQSTNCIFPDTPHNSIVQVDCAENHPNNANCDSSLQNFEDLVDNPNAMKIPPKKSTRCDDSAPIVSGGASIKDFTPKQCESPIVKRKTETCPIVSGGFVSLDLQQDDELKTNDKNLSKARDKQKFQQQSWVVDMSDCFSPNPQRRRSTSSSSSNDNTARSVDARIERSGSSASQRSGLGFYVSLHDMDERLSEKEIDNKINNSLHHKLSKSLHDPVKKSTGFYVDLSESESSLNATPPPRKRQINNNGHLETPPSLNGGGSSNSSISGSEKKNIFSMFIDFGDKKPIPAKREPLSLASRLSNSLQPKRNDDSSKTSCSSQETLMSGSQDDQSHCNSEKLDSAGETLAVSSDESRKPSLQLTDELQNSSSPVPMRRTINLQKDEQKRHSWNNSVQQNGVRREHKRSASLSSSSLPATDKNNIMNILDKIPFLSKTSSMSIDSSISPYDDFTCSKSELSTYSNNSATSTNSSGENENISKQISNKPQKKHRRDAQINETFDKSSVASIADSVLSKDLSPSSNTTDTDDLTFQQDDRHESNETITLTNQSKEICRQTMETIIETKETSSPKKTVVINSKPEVLKINKINNAHTMETLHATIEKQKMLLETVNEHTETANSDNFVKLSDLDKPSKFELHSSSEQFMSKSVGNQRHLNRLFQDNSTTNTTTNRIRPHSWAMTRSTGNSIQNITNSVENLRSLSRLFPHLSKEFSNSLPNDVYLEPGTSNVIVTTVIGNNRSPSELDYIHSDLSTESSLASSFSRSGLDESSISCRQPRRLGEDLLKMFLQEIATDVIVEVNGRRIKAHKCILRSRCQYFAAMLAGGWVQSAGNVISLQGYSYSSVHFALCHIYSGACHPPDGISLMELASLADLLGLEGLKEVTGYALKTNYCHNFHKPCSGCIDGILQVLPVALNHALDDLYRKCLKWTCKHYLKVWPTRAFAQLPADIFARCRQQIVAHLTSETVLECMLDCDHLISQLAHCRWAIHVENLVRDILDSAYAYISDHFASLIASDSFLSLGHDKSSNIQQLENILLRTASSLNPDQSCRSFQRVTRLNAVLAAKVIKMPTNLGDTNCIEDSNNTLVVEEEMEWNDEFIRLVSAILSAVEHCLTRQCSRAMRVSAWQRMDLELRKKIQKLACLTEPLDIRRSGHNNSVNFNNLSGSSSNSRNQDLYQVKLAIQAHSKRALAQDTQLYRATTTHTQTHTNNYHDRNTIHTIEKGVQVNNDNRESNSNKVMKTNSRAHVPMSGTAHFVNFQSQQQPLKPKPKLSTDKVKLFGHRRTQSEDSSVAKVTVSNTSKTIEKPTVQRLSEIRPRYLEPRKPRQELNISSSKSTGRPLNKSLNKTSSANVPKGKTISSSDSSRNSSPAPSKKLPINAKIGTKSINMSLDSLASPSKRSQSSANVKARIDNEISIDSLAGSMRSSMKTEKTISQESLIHSGAGKRISRSNPGINKVELTPTIVTTTTIATAKMRRPLSEALTGTARFGRIKPLQLQPIAQNQNTAGSGSSPSSVLTNKSSSRLSSVSSLANSPRDAYKNRSISTPATSNQNSSAIRKSFLSAKSREILAKRAANTTDSATSSSDIEKKSNENLNRYLHTQTKGTNGINKSVSSSNIPTRTRPAPPTTLHLKKKIIMNGSGNNTNDGLKKQISPHKNVHHQQQQQQQQNKIIINKTNNLNKRNLNGNNDHQKHNNNNIKQLTMKKLNCDDKKSYKKINENNIELVIVDDDDDDYGSNENKDFKIESKLERSSTFCKEISDLPVSELEIIE